MKRLLETLFLSVFIFMSYGNLTATTNDTSVDELTWFLIDKTTHTAYLQTLPPFPRSPKLIRNFKIATGKKLGDKFIEGDNRTPEGIYFTQPHIPGKDLWYKKYGPLAIPLDFPNPIDRMQKKGGYGIWLHGAGEDERIAKKTVTEGCIAFYNSEIVEAKPWLPPRTGIVMITDDPNINANKTKDKEELVKLTRSWLKSWNSSDIDSYISFYSENMNHKGRNIKNFYNYKKRVFSSYKEMNVQAFDLRVLVHQKYAVSLMNQDFNGDNRFKNYGRKILYWQKEAGTWKIVREAYGSTPFKKFNPSAPL